MSEQSQVIVKTLAQIEKEHILSTLAWMNGNRSQTAKALGISIRTMRNKLNKYSKESPCSP